jgi:DNA-binding XRE family transcriptional regulator
MEDLSKQRRMALEEAISVVPADRGLDVVDTESGKAFGQGLYEFRLRWTAAEVRRKASSGPGRVDPHMWKADGPDDTALSEVFRSDITLGLQFHDARTAMGLTQQELARRAGVPQADISRIERGAGNPTEVTLQRLARALGRQLVLV